MSPPSSRLCRKRWWKPTSTEEMRSLEVFVPTNTITIDFKVYGNFQAKSTFDGMLEANGDRRPFVFTRAGFIGGQRYAATWTGDNLATWEHLGMSIPMAINLGLSGQPFAGPDIGGFAGRRYCSNRSSCSACWPSQTHRYNHSFSCSRR